jgi:ribosomal protein S18 acetylase RimI-like enzyme
MINFRQATKKDVPSIVKLLADDELGAYREGNHKKVPEDYFKAFEEIEMQRGNFILLAVDKPHIIGCIQLTIIPGLARKGLKRAQIEGVRVDSKYRGKGIGKSLFQEAISIAKDEQCGLIQLTTDKRRKEAHHFYHKLGFTASHEGMKLIL